MKITALCLLFFVALAFGQTTRFTSQFRIFSANDPNWSGYLTGTLFYDWNFLVETNARGALTYQYTFSSGNIIELIRNQNLQGLVKTVRYLKCPTDCDSELGVVIPQFFLGTDWTIANGDTISFAPATGGPITCQAYTRNSASQTTFRVGDVTKMYVDPANGNRPCRAFFKNGRQIDFLTFGAFTDNSVFVFDNAVWQCPVPTCPIVLDLVQVLDESGSISSSDFQIMLNQFAVPLVNSYNFANFNSNPPQDGAIMSLVWFSGLANGGSDDSCNATVLTAPGGQLLTLRPDNNKQVMINAITTHRQWNGWTCTGGGVQVANSLFRSLYQNFPSRTTSSRVMLVVTDGSPNKICSTATNLQPGLLRCEPSSTFSWTLSRCAPSASYQTQCIDYISDSRTQIPGYCQTRTCGYVEFMSDVARSQLNILIIAVGVGTQINTNSIYRLAGNTNNAVLLTAGYSALANFLSTFVTQTCIDLGIPQCTNCRGFCACGGTCLCPSCDDSNFCTADVCLANKACSWSSISCDDGNACTADSCSSSLGSCVNTDNSARCNDGRFCTIDSCNPSTGCINVVNTCDDGDFCTTDTCNEAQSRCDHTTIAGCRCTGVNCTHIPCQNNVCNPNTGSCGVVSSVTCDDGNACTNDACNVNVVGNNGLLGGCEFLPKNCSDGNACTDDTCDPATGCISTPFNVSVVCDDFDLCTVDTCDSALGCTHSPINCSLVVQSPPCFVAQCLVPQIGCAQYRVECIPPGESADCYFSSCTANDIVTVITDENGTILNTTITPGDGICRPERIEGTCKPKASVNVPLAAGLAAGILALIIIAVIICAVCGALSGYGAYKYYKRSDKKLTGVQENPLFEAKKETVNPLFQERE